MIVNKHAARAVRTLDDRGILQSIASRNDYSRAASELKRIGLFEYFLHPQINWNSKVSSIQTIAQSLNIALDSIAFIDDQLIERDEVRFSMPEVLCLDPSAFPGLLLRPELTPQFVSDDARNRRLRYLSDIERNKAEEEFVGPREEFLASLDMVFTISTAKSGDLDRLKELTIRTNQLNTTGYTYSHDELDYFRKSPRHRLLVASLSDKYGDHGTVGLTLIERLSHRWTIKLLLMSCRVMSRGVGMILVNHILKAAEDENAQVFAEFVPNDRNRNMYATYRFAGFKEIRRVNELTIMKSEMKRSHAFPDYVRVEVEDCP